MYLPQGHLPDNGDLGRNEYLKNHCISWPFSNHRRTKAEGDDKRHSIEIIWLILDVNHVTSSDAMTKYDLIYQQPMCPQVNSKNAIQETSAMRLEKNFNSTMLWQWKNYVKTLVFLNGLVFPHSQSLHSSLLELILIHISMIDSIGYHARGFPWKKTQSIHGFIRPWRSWHSLSTAHSDIPNLQLSGKRWKTVLHGSSKRPNQTPPLCLILDSGVHKLRDSKMYSKWFQLK